MNLKPRNKELRQRAPKGKPNDIKRKERVASRYGSYGEENAGGNASISKKDGENGRGNGREASKGNDSDETPSCFRR